MVKKRVGGAHRYKAVKAAAAAGQAEPQQQQKQQQQQDAGPKPPSHLQRKITKSVKFYEKVLASGAPKAPQGVQKKSAKKQRSSKTLANLDSLAAELGNIPAAGSGKAGGGSSGSLSEQQAALLLRGKGTKSSIKRSRARLAVGVSESSRLQKVLQHPVYKSDPIQAVMNHLLNTLPAAPQQQQQQQRKQGAPGQQQQQQKRRKKSKQGGGAGGGVADMQD